MYDTPRLQQAYGKDYAFSGTISKALPIPEIFVGLIEYMNMRYSRNFNMLLINWYLTGENYIGMHSDDESKMTPDSPVITISFGSTRDFVLKNKTTNEKIMIPMTNNDVLVMGGKCQKTHRHGVPKRLRVKSPRISVTLREFI
jgi:alkylated DNA repair dioxygenase AlkB